MSFCMNESATVHPPWYRQFWPWVLIAIPLSAVIMGGITLWLALANPDYLVVDDQEYERIRSEMRARQAPETPPGDDGTP
jgi:hypothetical protein